MPVVYKHTSKRPRSCGLAALPLTVRRERISRERMDKSRAHLRERRSLVLRTIYAFCLLGATWNHWAVIYMHGVFWDYGGLPRGSTTFWTMLALLDPATVILLFWRPNIGVTTTAIIILCDVINNVWITTRFFPPLFHWSAGRWQLIAQIAFLIFVATTAAFAWTRNVRSPGKALA